MPEHDDVGGRRGWFLQTRVGADGQLPPAQLLNASRQHRLFVLRHRTLMEAPGAPGTVNWTPLGPSAILNGQASGAPMVSGRVTALAVGPGSQRVYLGSANGGLWFSADYGESWTALDEFAVSPDRIPHLEADSLSVGALAVRFDATNTANDVLFVGTGEPGGGMNTYFGVGIKHSDNGGNSWLPLEATNLARLGVGIYKIVIDPVAGPPPRLLVFAATSAGLYQRPSAAPFSDWTRVDSSNFTHNDGAATDLIVVRTASAKKYYVAFDSDKVYESSNEGATWSAVAGFTPGGRVALTAGENDPSIVYALSYAQVKDANGNLTYCDPKLMRRDGTGGFRPVTGVPPDLFGELQ